MLTNELKGLAKATLLSGGVISHGSVAGYISDSARRGSRFRSCPFSGWCGTFI